MDIMDFKIECAYAAGFIDGDGYITLLFNNKERIVPTLMVQVGACGSDERPLARLQRAFGGKVYLEPFRRASMNRPFYQWHVHGSDAVTALKSIREHLTLKRDQADLAILAFDVCQSQWLDNPGVKSRRQRGESNYDNPTAIREARQILRDQMAVLNSHPAVPEGGD